MITIIRKLLNAFAYCTLDNPLVYELSQQILAPGARTRLTNVIRDIATGIGKDGTHLDVGCGPSSWLWNIGWLPVGLDITPQYTEKFRSRGFEAVTASSTAIPFQNDHFSTVWAIGLFHHISDPMIGQTIAEMKRVCKPGGTVVIMDAILPGRFWRRPIAWMLRKLDKGMYVRSRKELLGCFADLDRWHHYGVNYSLFGHEAEVLTFVK